MSPGFEAGVGGGACLSSDAQAAAAACLTDRLQALEFRLGVGVGVSSRAVASIEPREFGIPGDKSWGEVARELMRSGAELMIREDVDGSCEPVRVVNIVLVRLHPSQEDRRVLMETAHRRGDGADSSERLQLPSEPVMFQGDRKETRGEVVAKIQHKLLSNVPVSFCLDTVEVNVKEMHSDDYPGIKTLYYKEIVEGHITSSDPWRLRGVGLSSTGAATFSVDGEGDSSTEYTWFTEEQLSEKGAQLRYRADLSETPALVPLETGEAAPDRAHAPLCKLVKDVHGSVAAAFDKDVDLLRLERLVQSIEEPWLSSMGTGAPLPAENLRSSAARRAHVVQHGDQLRGFVGDLAEVERSQSAINYPELEQVPSHCVRLQRLEAGCDLLSCAAARLHEEVSSIAEEYHSAMVALNSQLLAWDSALDRKIASKR